METIQENEYVTRELHDLQLERIELLIERNLSRQEVIAAGMKADIAELKGDVKALNAKVDGLEKKVDARIDGVMDAIALTNMRIDDLKSTQSNNMAKWGIIIAVGICAVQIIASVILHFWK